MGFIGSNLARACLELGAKVTIFDCLDPRSGGNPENIAEIEQDIELLVQDVRNFDGIAAAIRGHDVVFNCAAYTSHPQSMKDPLTDIEVNCRGVINLLEAARRFNPGMRIVHLGTSTQIGPMRGRPIDETHAEFPADIYSANKTASEKYVLIYGKAYGLHVTVIRLANIYGPRSNIQSPDFGFMNYFIGLALRNRPIPVYGDGAQVRNVMFVDDAVAALLHAAACTAAAGQVLFAVSDDHYDVAQLAAAIALNIGGTVQSVPWPRNREVIEIGDAIISGARARELLRWRPSVDLEAGLHLTRDYFLPRLDRYIP
jgi:UDP-glucose 4-epimerase